MRERRKKVVRGMGRGRCIVADGRTRHWRRGELYSWGEAMMGVLAGDGCKDFGSIVKIFVNAMGCLYGFTKSSKAQ